MSLRDFCFSYIPFVIKAKLSIFLFLADFFFHKSRVRCVKMDFSLVEAFFRFKKGGKYFTCTSSEIFMKNTDINVYLDTTLLPWKYEIICKENVCSK
jgi:hypothetical protein